jgi:hypothetical protein
MPVLNDLVPCENHSPEDLGQNGVMLIQENPPPEHSGRPQRKSAEPKPIAPVKNSLVDHVASYFTDVVSQIWTGDRIGEYLAATDARRHVWHAWLSAKEQPFRLSNPMSADLAYHKLTFASGDDLIAEAYACKPAGIIQALGKLGIQARYFDIYRGLVRVLAAGGAAAKHIRHASEIPDDLILGLSSLPPKLRTKPIVEILKNRHVSDESLCFFAGTLERLRAQDPQVAEVILAAPRPLDALWEALQDLPFPEPPWPKDKHLIPVTSRSRLTEIAKEFQNCLRDTDRQLRAVMSVINGNRFFYELRAEPALLEFVRIGSLGWYLRQACGPENRPISERARSGLILALAKNPSYCAAWEPFWRERYYPKFDVSGLLWAA